MAATPKPVRKYIKKVHKDLESKHPQIGFTRKHAKDIAKSHVEKGLVTRKGHADRPKIKAGLETSRKMMKSKKK